MTTQVKNRHDELPADQRESFASFLNERLGLAGLRYPVPVHANTLPYLLGGITLFSFLVLLASGVLLAQFYNPNPSAAHASVIYIIENVAFGDLIRSVHFWSANILVLTLVLHLIRIFISGSYKRPREVNWLVGLGLFAVSLGFFFTGSVLKWDQEAVEALAHNREMGELLGSVGVWFTSEFTLSVPILTRLYIGHLTLLPAAFAVLIITHLYLIKQHGISQKPTEEATSGQLTKDNGSSRFSLHLRKMTGYGLLLFAGVVILASTLPATLGQPGVPGVEVTKPPWMFLPFYPLEDVFGIRGLLIGSTILFASLALVPFIDRSKWLSPRRRRWIIIVGVIIFALVIALGIFAWTSRPVPHLMQ